MIKIRVFNPQTPNDVKEVDLKPEVVPAKECFIGRSPNSELRLDNDLSVGRLHGKISFQNGQYYFADLASKSGSWINNEQVKVTQDYLLKNGDVVRIGGFVLMVVEISQENSTPTLPPKPPNDLETVVYGGNIDPMPVASVDPANFTRWTKGELTVRCVQIIDETHDVKTFRFVADPSLLFTYKPGQFATLNLQINGEEVLRSYSISSTPSRPHSLDITIKRVPPPPGSAADVPPGLVSNWMHDNIKVGSEILLSGPMGKFTCFEKPSQKLLLISAGSGITPMMSMSRWICDTGADVDIFFFHCARSPRDIIFRQELELMSAQNPNFQLVVSTTRKESGHSWLSLTGRLDAAMLELIAPDFKERTVYVCGPNPFMEAVKEMLEGIGFPMQNYYEESFGPPAKKKNSKSAEVKQPVPASANNIIPHQRPRNFEDIMKDTLPEKSLSSPVKNVDVPSPSSNKPVLVFSKSSKQVDCDGEENILELAEQQEVKIRSSCRAGTCGACKKRKVEGEIRYQGEPDALDDDEKQEGYILTCIAYPVGRVVIEA
jgi:glycine betaine catabolism B